VPMPGELFIRGLDFILGCVLLHSRCRGDRRFGHHSGTPFRGRR
jgi:hypothetical protein